MINASLWLAENFMQLNTLRVSVVSTQRFRKNGQHRSQESTPTVNTLRAKDKDYRVSSNLLKITLKIK